MIRFVFRFLGLLLLALGFIFLVYDGTKSIADQNLYISTVGATWANVHETSLSALQPVVERLAGPWFWQAVVQRYLLDQPASLVLAVLAATMSACFAGTSINSGSGTRNGSTASLVTARPQAGGNNEGPLGFAAAWLVMAGLVVSRPAATR